jgi:hypothetical protein
MGGFLIPPTVVEFNRSTAAQAVVVRDIGFFFLIVTRLASESAWH